MVDGRSETALSDELLPVAGAPRHARNLATEACLRWDVPHLVGPAGLIVTELVNNVIVHAGTMCTLQLTVRLHRLTISVSDGSIDAPLMLGPVAPGAPSGRGLLIVDAVADSWGWRPSEAGKVVWATLA